MTNISNTANPKGAEYENYKNYKNELKFGEVFLKWLGHDTFLIEYKNKKIVIDPFKLNTNLKADYILITHSHYDHCSLEDISKLTKETTKIICPPDCSSEINKVAEVELNIVEPNQEVELDDFSIKTIPAYNIGKDFHKKTDNWVGYIINIGSVKIYHAGDTDLIPEMKELESENIDIALLPVGGVYTMDYKEAAEAVKIINPKIAVPMHYGTIVGNLKDAQMFKELTGEKAVILKKNHG